MLGVWAIPSGLLKRPSAWESHSQTTFAGTFAGIRHITNITNKACKTRVLEEEPEGGLLVRPTLEFASPVWDPYTVKNINKLEAVQKRVARWVVNRHRQTFSV